MPCRDEAMEVELAALRQRERDAERQENARFAAHVVEEAQALTRRLCAVLTVVDRLGDLGPDPIRLAEKADGVAPGEIAAWWAKHKEADAARAAREKEAEE